jgi:hypothetical protein
MNKIQLLSVKVLEIHQEDRKKKELIKPLIPHKLVNYLFLQLLLCNVILKEATQFSEGILDQFI